MIKLIFVFLVFSMLIAFLHKGFSEATLKHYKLAFKIGAIGTLALLTMIFISLF